MIWHELHVAIPSSHTYMEGFSSVDDNSTTIVNMRLILGNITSMRSITSMAHRIGGHYSPLPSLTPYNKFMQIHIIIRLKTLNKQLQKSLHV